MNTFRPGQIVRLESGRESCEIRALIGSGGRGQVYHASVNGQDCALKWFFPHCSSPGQRTAIDRLIQKGPPNDRFLWPVDIALGEGVSGFGYVMPLREPRYRGMAEVMSRWVDPTFTTLTTVALELVDSFLRLHSLGFFYSDISFGNIFFDPVTGEVCICDNDSLTVHGEEASRAPGNSRFMAPEIVRGESNPGMGGDLHSLAVILFYLFMVHHPLEGRREREIPCLDLAEMKKLYGTEALFIFDPKHGANRPVAGIHNNATVFWNLYPGYVREAFTRAFTEGLQDAAARVRESEWRTVFTRMRDQIFYCPTCGAENFLAAEGEVPEALVDQKCWSCQEIAMPPPRLLIESHSVALNRNVLLYAHHLDPNRRDDYSEALAEMVSHPKRPEVWGLKNLSGRPWTAVPPAGAAVEVAPGRSVSLVPGLRIAFGEAEGTVI